MKKETGPSDPQAAREAANYDNPIASRELILETLRNSGVPMNFKELADALQINQDEPLEALRRRLNAMQRDGQIVRNRKQGFGLIEKMDLIKGRILGHRDGYGFLVPVAGGDDVYISARQMRGVLDGDDAVVSIVGRDPKGRREGRIVDVLSRNTSELVGRYFRESGVGYVVPENPRIGVDIAIPQGGEKQPENGQFVVVRLVTQPTWQTRPVGEISEVLGDHMAPGMEIDVAIRSYGIPHVWPHEVEQQIAPLQPDVSDEDKQHRVDLRAMSLLTIDGEDARDFDDAVYCEKKSGGGWRLWVAIADVSHYVRPNTPLDREAIARGNSVYFPGRVVPMLPEILSNGLCSLNPEVDRLCMVAEMTVSATGTLSSYCFYEAVMHSKARLTYNKVAKMLDDRSADNPLRERYAAVVPVLENLHDLFQALRKARYQRGAIDFETTETQMVFGADKKIAEIVPVVRNDAHKLIEECMLCANVAAARFLEKHDLPGLFRVHNGPKEERLGNLRDFLGGLGLDLTGGENPTPSDYQALLQAVADRPDASLIQTMMLRSMSQAIYSPDNQGHFGLHYSAYTHFTSPIRRYPDLLTHRAIRYVIRSGMPSNFVRRVDGATPLSAKDIYPYDLGRMVNFGEQTSMTERRADEATRDVVSWLKCEYLLDKVGEEFRGVVVAVTNFGLFVELQGLYVEGLVHVTALQNDYYQFDAARMCLIGERTGVIYGLGDQLSVQVAAVKLEERKVDLELLGVVTTVRRRKSDSGKNRSPISEVAASRSRKRSDAKGGKQGGGKPEKRPAKAAKKPVKKSASSKKKSRR
jgi:ribonuclease R